LVYRVYGVLSVSFPCCPQAKQAQVAAVAEGPKIQLPVDLPLEERLAGLLQHLEEAQGEGRLPDVVGTGEELERGMEVLRQVMALPMRRHRKWVKYLTEVLSQLKRTLDVILAIMQQVGLRNTFIPAVKVHVSSFLIPMSSADCSGC
jgi:hypothetical protein